MSENLISKTITIDDNGKSIELSQSFRKFRRLEIIYSRNAYSHYAELAYIYVPRTWGGTYQQILSFYDGSYVILKFPDATHIQIAGYTGTSVINIFEIYGLLY